MLAHGGFKLKFFSKSGEPPPEGASSNGTSLKTLGYKWQPVADTFSPGLEEVNFNRKRRGVKKPHETPLDTANEIVNYLDDNPLTKRKIAAKLAEFHDPIGMWEPYKMQLKLQNSKLNGLDWDEPLIEDFQSYWKGSLTVHRVSQMLQF